MSLPISIGSPKVILLDNRKLLQYAQEVRERFDVDPDELVWMDDIVAQAALDGDIILPVGWKIGDDWSEGGYTVEQIEEMVEIYADANDDPGMSWD